MHGSRELEILIKQNASNGLSLDSFFETRHPLILESLYLPNTISYLSHSERITCWVGSIQVRCRIDAYKQ